MEFHGALNSGTSGIDYTYEIDSDLVSLEHQFDVSTDVEFAHAYDASGRLTATATDVSGWLWSANSVAWTRDYSSFIDTDTDQITGWTGYEAQSGFTYDDNGNMTYLPNYRHMFHDSMNRMWAIAGEPQASGSAGGWDQAGGGSAESSAFLYDADGRRIVRTSSVSGVDNLRFAHAGDMEIADVNDQGGSGIVGRIMRRYVPGAGVDDRVVMIITNTATCSSLNGSVPYSGSVCATSSYEYYHADRLGNVVAMVNASGTITAQYVYTPYGVEEPYNASGNPYRYTGRRLEPEWGIFHYRARYYDPALGRFLETDPVLYADQMNLYAYVGSDPINFIDPTGETDIFVGGNRDSIAQPMERLANYQRQMHPERTVSFVRHGDVSALQTALADAATRDEPINVICHSQGCATAFEAMSDTPVSVDLLVTLDPVDDVLPDSDGLGISALVGEWRNIETGHMDQPDLSDAIRRAGDTLNLGDFDTSGSDNSTTLPFNHAQTFRMFFSQASDGISAASAVERTYERPPPICTGTRICRDQ